MLVIIAAFAVGCEERAARVCCTTETDCQNLGLPAGSVGNYGCAESQACVDLMCVAAPDAARGDAGVDGPRCDPSAAFEPGERISALSNGYAVHSLSLTADELTAYIVFEVGGPYRLLMSVRESIDASFSTPALRQEIVVIGRGETLRASVTGDGRKIYMLRRPDGFRVSSRTDDQSAFPDDLSFGVTDTSSSVVGFQAISASGQTLYWRDLPSARLYASALYDEGRTFMSSRSQSQFEMFDATLTADELTVYYRPTGTGAIMRTSRTTRANQFVVGAPALGLNTVVGEEPLHVTADDCEIYYYAPATADSDAGVYRARRGRAASAVAK